MPYLINDQSFKDTLTNNIISFEQLGPGIFITQYISFKRGIGTTFVGDTFCGFLFSAHYTTSKKGSALKGKHLHPLERICLQERHN